MTDAILALCGLVEFIGRLVIAILFGWLMLMVDESIGDLLKPYAWQVIETRRSK